MGDSEVELAKLVCIESKAGLDFTVIGTMFQITPTQVFELIAKVFGLSSRDVKSALKMKRSGKSTESIGLRLNLPLIALNKFLPNTPQSSIAFKRTELKEIEDLEKTPSSTSDQQLTKKKSKTFVPKYTFNTFYSDCGLNVTELRSGREFRVFIPNESRYFKTWCQSSKGKLYFVTNSRKSICMIDIFRDFASSQIAEIALMKGRSELDNISYHQAFFYIIY